VGYAKSSGGRAMLRRKYACVLASNSAASSPRLYGFHARWGTRRRSNSSMALVARSREAWSKKAVEYFPHPQPRLFLLPDPTSPRPSFSTVLQLGEH
jgi:hypothetical protein